MDDEREIDSEAFAKLQLEAKRARDLEFTINSLTEQLNKAKQELNTLYSTTMVELMDEAGVDHIGLAAEGNYPGRDYKVKKYASANIAAAWSEERREAAFEYLKSMNAEDLIKTEVVAYYPRGEVENAKILFNHLQQKRIKSELSKTVHSGTLGAWLRELIEKRKIVPPPDDLAKIGGAVGRIVKVEDRKE